jgi:hypothetical protein
MVRANMKANLRERNRERKNNGRCQIVQGSMEISMKANSTANVDVVAFPNI